MARLCEDDPDMGRLHQGGRLQWQPIMRVMTIVIRILGRKVIIIGIGFSVGYGFTAAPETEAQAATGGLVCDCLGGWEFGYLE